MYISSIYNGQRLPGQILIQDNFLQLIRDAIQFCLGDGGLVQFRGNSLIANQSN